MTYFAKTQRFKDGNRKNYLECVVYLFLFVDMSPGPATHPSRQGCISRNSNELHSTTTKSLTKKTVKNFNRCSSRLSKATDRTSPSSTSRQVGTCDESIKCSKENVKGN